MTNDVHGQKTSHAALALAALGIVFGDIGTSPLYALREAFHGPHALAVNSDNILGVLSLIVWSLILIISVKYLLFVLRADNKGEGGVLALTALAAPPNLVTKFLFNRVLLYLGLFGSALLFGDGVITPAISVLSAIEGLKVATPHFEPYVIGITVTILAALFSVQRHGTAKIGAVFGPIILIWFLTIGALGIMGIAKSPAILWSVNPTYAVNFLVSNGWESITVLGAVFLVVTGGEALYADMGHLGKKPIQTGWFYVALPGLVLNYFGQGALLLDRPAAAENPFYLLAPSWFLYFLVLISTLATVIASQALISGVFSLTRQAVQLGYFPRLQIIHTSIHEIGQIYIPFVNWTLFSMTIWLVYTFGSSSNLASAYGIAVSTTMIITTLLTCAVAWQSWRWKLRTALTVLALFLSIDFVFFSANLIKIAEGGWFPLTLGSVVFLLMTTWRRGRKVLAERLAEKVIPLQEFLTELTNQRITRVPGTAIFMSGSSAGAPLPLIYNVKHNKCLHQRNAILTVIAEEIPYIPKKDRLEIVVVGENFHRIIVRFGFMEKPDIRFILKLCKEKGLSYDLPDITFCLGRETILPTKTNPMALWRQHLFAFMSKNAQRATAYFNIPPNQVAEIGIQIEF